MTQPLLTPREHSVKAMLLRARNPNSRAAQLHEIAADIKDLQARWQQKGLSALHNERCVTFKSQPMFL